MADSTNPDSTQDVGGNQVDNLRVYFWNGVDELVRFDASNPKHRAGEYPAVFVSEYVSKEAFEHCPLDPANCIITKDGTHHVLDPEGKPQVNDLAKWDVKALKNLLKSAQSKSGDTT